jgi:hypothetical protein
MLQPSTLADDGCVVNKELATLNTKKAIETILGAASANKLTIEERMEAKQRLDSYFTSVFVLQPKSQQSIADTIKMCVVPRDEWHWCLLCGKWATGTHTEGSDHCSRVMEMAAINEMIGPCASMRRWAPTPGLQGPLTQNAFKAFWGTEVAGMPQLVWQRLREGTTIRVSMPHWGKKSKKTLSFNDIREIEFAVVSYPGPNSGKYNIESERAVMWDDISTLEDEDGQMLQPHRQIPPTSGWWPVCAISWHTQALDHGFEEWGPYVSATTGGILCIYILCWYQLYNGTIVIEAWPILRMQQGRL